VNASDDLAIFPNDHFDFIYTNITLQHIEPRYSERYMEEFCRVLARQGVLIFQLPIPVLTRASLTDRVKSFIPYPIRIPLLSLYRLLRYGDLDDHPYPWIEMHAIKRKSVLALLRRCRMKVVDIKPSADVAPGFRYCVTKE
jgi:SAM-dependent methyltransferase